jgi:hypothetical protein
MKEPSHRAVLPLMSQILESAYSLFLACHKVNTASVMLLPRVPLKADISFAI